MNFIREGSTKKIVIVMCEALAAVLVASFIASFASNVIENASQTLFNNRLTVLANQNQAEVSATLQEDYKKVSPYLTAIRASVPVAENLSSFQSAIEAVKVSSGASRASLQLDQNEPQADIPPFKKTGFTIVLGGSLDSAIKYLASLERIPFFVIVNSVDATAGSNGEFQSIISGIVYIR